MRASRVQIERSRGESQWPEAAHSVLPWLVPALLVLYIKENLLEKRNRGGYVIVARALGRLDDHLNLWEKLSFFRGDLLVAFILVPLALLLLSRYLLPIRWRTSFVAIFSLVVTIVLYVESCAFDEAGHFLPLTLLWRGIGWGLFEDRSAIFTYLNWQVLLGIVGVALALAIAMRREVIRKKQTPRNPAPEQRGYIAAMITVSCVIGLTIAAWASPLAATPFHQEILGWVYRSLWNPAGTGTREFADLSADELQNRYREIASPPAADANTDNRYWAKARGGNVLFLVLETAPAKVLPADGDLADFPNLARLREKSFVGASHYTTYVATHEAMFSIFSSWYPSSILESPEIRQGSLVIPGIMRRLADQGYDTAYYSPHEVTQEADRGMFNSLGIQRLNFPEPLPADTPLFSPDQIIRGRIALDAAALALLKHDLERDLNEGRRFAYLYAPQVSHGPWADETGKEPDVEKRGRHLLAITDHSLGEIMDILERHHQLDTTVIVVVGDHGVRDRSEDPVLPTGVLDDYSFHVPLVIYAPQALDHTEEIPWITSHIDIAPTVLSLLGIDQGPSAEQGTPIWNPGLRNRTTFFFSHDFLGADGYYSHDKFFMWSQVSDTVYENRKMSFGIDNIVPHRSLPQSSPEDEGARTLIRQINGLDDAWSARFSSIKPPQPSALSPVQ